MCSAVPRGIQPAELENYLHEQIPLTRAMDLSVVESGARVVLEAPLAPNANHLGTAFGGSLHTLPTLACYTALWILLREHDVEGHVVVKRSQASYLQPVTGVLRAVCVRPPAEITARFISDLRRHKRARMELDAIVTSQNERPAVTFIGTFVALIKQP